MGLNNTEDEKNKSSVDKEFDSAYEEALNESQSLERKSKNGRMIGGAIAIAAIVVLMIIAACTTNSETVTNTFWALVPPIVAIGLALVTKEVYSSLFVGIIVGGLLYAGFNFQDMVVHVYSEGIVSVSYTHLDEGDSVSDILNECGYVNVEIIKDLAGMDRVVKAYKSSRHIEGE